MRPISYNYRRFSSFDSHTRLLPMIPIEINAMLESNALVDTGSTGILLPHSLAKASCVMPLDGASTTVDTVGGQIRSFDARIDSLLIPRLGIWQDVDAQILPPESRIPFPLLGIEDILSGFDITFSPHAKRLSFFLPPA